MAIVMKSARNGKKIYTSSCFAAIDDYKSTVNDIYSTTTYSDRHSTMRDKIAQIKVQAIAESMILAKQGCAEVAQFARDFKGDLSNVIFDYGPAKPSEDYDDMKAELEQLEASEEPDQNRIEYLQSQIEEIDHFVELQLEAVRA